MIQERIYNLAKEGFTVTNTWCAAENTIEVRVFKVDTDKMLFKNTYLLSQADFEDEVAYLDSISMAAEAIDIAIDYRSKMNVETCRHEFLGIPEGQFIRKICMYCKGKFGYREFQNVALPIN